MVEDSTYLISTCSQSLLKYDEDAQDKLWISIRNTAEDAKQPNASAAKKPYGLVKGDVVKLGRIKFKIKDCKVGDSISSVTS